jgi:tRNA threonylcarbamoyladenosine biosynthesis protein TsaB
VIRVALETSTPVGSVAVGRGSDLLAEVALGIQTRHAEGVLPGLELALSLAGVERADVGEVVVGAGPGSFTGVRVAASTAKGLVAALERPLLAFPSLLALAAGVPAAGPVCALFDARRGGVYGGCWVVAEEQIQTLVAPMVGAVTEVVAAVTPLSPAVLFAGDGAVRYRHELVAAGVSAERVARVPVHPRASVLLWLAEHHSSGARVGDVASWEPLYVRGSSAKVF